MDKRNSKRNEKYFELNKNLKHYINIYEMQGK